MARLGREESLSACRVQLSNGKKLSLARLRGNARVVVCAGTHEQVRGALSNPAVEHTTLALQYLALYCV